MGMENKRNLLTLLIVGTLYLFAVLLGCCTTPEQKSNINVWTVGGQVDSVKYFYSTVGNLGNDTLVYDVTYVLMPGNGQSLESKLDPFTMKVSIISSSSAGASSAEFQLPKEEKAMEEYLITQAYYLNISKESIVDLIMVMESYQDIRDYNNNILERYERYNK